MSNIQEKKIWLEQFDCFSILGKDGRRFLNGITTSDILNLNNKVLKTCWLTPNGILKSLLEINCLENKLEVIILVGNTNEIREYFNNIIFPSDDVSLSDTFSINRYQEVDDIHSWRINQPIFFKNEDKKFILDHNNQKLMNNNDLKIWKIKQAIPSLDNEINGKNNPLELGLLDLIDLIFDIYSKSKNIFTNSAKEKSVGYITSFYKLDSSKIVGLAIIKRKYLENENYFFSENFGQISIAKSLGSTFL